MYTVQASDGTHALHVGPYSVEDALLIAASLRDQGHVNITLTKLETGVTVDLEQFMRNPPRA